MQRVHCLSARPDRYTKAGCEHPKHSGSRRKPTWQSPLAVELALPYLDVAEPVGSRKAQHGGAAHF